MYLDVASLLNGPGTETWRPVLGLEGQTTIETSCTYPSLAFPDSAAWNIPREQSTKAAEGGNLFVAYMAM